MNGFEKPFGKNPIQKIEKTVKKETETAAREQKVTTQKFHAAKPLAFSLHFLFMREQNHYYNFTSKS